MATTKVESTALRRVAEQLNQYSESFNSKLSENKNTNSNLANVWKGNDADKYVSAVNEQAKIMDELYKYLQSTAEYMKNVAKTYEDVISSNMGGINM